MEEFQQEEEHSKVLIYVLTRVLYVVYLKEIGGFQKKNDVCANS